MHIVLWQTAFDIGNLQKDGNHFPVNACSLSVPGSFTGTSRMLHGCFTGVSRVAHGTKSVFRVSNGVSNTLVSRVVHGCFTGRSRYKISFCGSLTVSLTHWSHGWFTGGSRVVHGSLTVQNQFFGSLTVSLTHWSHGWFTGVSRVAHGTKSVFRVSNPVFLCL